MKIVCGKRLYTVTDNDVIQLSLAVHHEGRVHEQVAQVLVNCFAYLHSTKPRACPSLAWLVRAYAQPINPAWFPDGKQFLHWHARDPKKYPLAAAIRRRDVHSKVTQISPTALAAVGKALKEGPVSIPQNATDYAAAWVDASHKYKPLTAPKHGENRLWTRAEKWQGYRTQS